MGGKRVATHASVERGSAGDAVLVTVPLGVLKKGSIQFSPHLPVRKQEAVRRVGFGLLNKVSQACA